HLTISFFTVFSTSRFSTLSLHDALPILFSECRRVTGNAHDAEDASQLAFLALAIEIRSGTAILRAGAWLQRVARRQALKIVRSRSEEHTSELQSRGHLVCRLLLEKKNKK